MSQRYVLGNWKMNGTPDSLQEFADSLPQQDPSPGVVMGLALPAPLLGWAAAKKVLPDWVRIGAQSAHWETAGAYTGEVSLDLLDGIGCQFVIAGHSERRQYFGETNETAGLRFRAAHAAGLVAVLCVGESAQERADGAQLEVVQAQLTEALSQPLLGSAVALIAYEPVWAIGSGKVATLEQIQSMHEFIADLSRKLTGDEMRVLYGGSVKGDNATEIFALNSVSGALVGGASLDAREFVRICEHAGKYT